VELLEGTDSLGVEVDTSVIGTSGS